MVRTLNRYVLVGLLAALVAPLAGVLGYEIWVNRGARQELLVVRDQLRIGMTRVQVLETLHSADSRKLKVVSVGNEQELLVQTPFQFGAGNWDMWLTFAQGRLRAIQVRTADGRHARPRDGPADIVGR